MQVLELLEIQRARTGRYDQVFPSVFNPLSPIADATLNHLFKRLDFGVPEFSPHGARGTAASLLREHKFRKDVTDLMLAHGSANQTDDAYYLLEFADERREASQYLSELIDRLAANVVEKKAA